MSMRTKLTAPFAHLLGLAASAEDDEDKVKKGRRAEEDDDKDDDKDKDKDGKAKRAEDDKEKDDNDGDAKGTRAEDDDKDDEKKSSRRAKGEGDDDDEDMEDDEDEMRGNSASAKARRRERARCAAIFGCQAAGVRPDVAATLAFSTNMSRQEAIAVLTSTASGSASRRRGLDERMAGVKTPSAGVDGGASAPAGMTPVAAAIVAAGEKARGK